MKAVLSIFFVCLFFGTNAQDKLDPVKWSFDSEKVGENEYKVSFMAAIEDGWAVYSQFIEEGGPIATTFTFENHDGITLKEGVVEPDEKETKFDEMFEMELVKIKKDSEFYQMVATKGENKVLKGYLTFMACDDSKCLPPTDIDFEIIVE